jgi:pyoverdine/dityrosine biosynthesis protein Dit1
MTIMSDGRVFADLVGVHDDVVSMYRDALHAMPTRHVRWDSLDNHVHGDTHDAVRAQLQAQYGMSADELDVSIRSQGESLMVYRYVMWCVGA